MVGTIHYVAPEQIEGGRVDARTDIYSLGCLLYHCLSGELPFARDTDVAVIYAHLSEEPPRLTSVRPELPGGLDAVIAKALEKAPERRFQTCADLMSAARSVIDAAGPLVRHRDAAAGARRSAIHFDVPTSTGASAACPPTGDSPLDATRASAARRSRATSRPRGARACCSPASTRTRARVTRVAVGDRVDVEEAPHGRVAARERPRRPPRPRDPRLERARASPRARSSPRCAPTPSTRDAKVLLLVEHKQPSSGDVAAAGRRRPACVAPFSPLQLQVKLRKLLGADAVAG